PECVRRRWFDVALEGVALRDGHRDDSGEDAFWKSREQNRSSESAGGGEMLWAVAGVAVGVAAFGFVAWPLMFPGLAAFRWVWPSSADPRLGAKTPLYGRLPHLAKAPEKGETPSGFLHVFLPGTLAHPAFHTTLLAAVAETHRHHTIGLAYRYSWQPSGEVGKRIREMHPDDEAKQAEELERFHSSVALGGPKGPFVGQVFERDSIVGRVRSALIHLSRAYPDEGWEGGPMRRI
ncbi:Uncharacterized protein SCF082_LOCUS18068, partial [Durusdinium trenchii]